MEISNIDELKNLIREIVREELGIGKTTESNDKQAETAKTDNSHEVNKIREHINQISNIDEQPKALPSTPLSPGDNTITQPQSTPNPQTTVDDMEI